MPTIEDPALHRSQEIRNSSAMTRLNLLHSAATPQRWDLAAPVSPASSQGLSEVADANEESVEELADTDQAFESAAVEGIGDTADHPERPTHIHEQSWRPDDVPPRKTA